MTTPVRRALVSVSDKRNLATLAELLIAHKVEVLSTGGTAKALAELGVAVVKVSDYTGSPEVLGGRVKTLHPRIHGGILALPTPEHEAEARQHDIPPIDLVVVNLYPFAEVTAKPDCTFATAIENIDIGGPTMVRAAAKNWPRVGVVVDPDDYGPLAAALQESGGVLPEALRRRLCRKAFAHTAAYDSMIASYLSRHDDTGEALAPEAVSSAVFLGGEQPTNDGNVQTKVEGALRYGENPHQAAAFIRLENGGDPRPGLADARVHQGKALSFNNILDLDSAFGLAVDLSATQQRPVAVFIKHNNPCGAATQATVADALRIAREVDALSAFGSVVAVSAPLDEEAASVLTESFVEAVIAPSITPEARPILAKKKNLRVLELSGESHWQPKTQWEPRVVQGGLLVQSKDTHPDFVKEAADAKTATKRDPTAEERAGLAFAWAAAKHVRSNAIVFAKRDRLVAVGAGQMSRVDSVKICKLKAGDALRGSVVASDAFFPFRDGVDVLAEAGATAIIQPGGSKRDGEVVTAADEHGVAMLFTGVRHFRH